MKSDIDALMQEYNLDALLITGSAQHNPAMVYLTGGGHLTHADLIKKRGEPPILFHLPMERDEAAKTGLRTKNLDDYHIHELLKQSQGRQDQAIVRRYLLMLKDMNLNSGRVALMGIGDVGRTLIIFSQLQAAMPGLEFVGAIEGSILLDAMMTKDATEIEHIRQMGKVTTEVVALTADFLCSHRAKNDVLVTEDGTPLTIKDVKRRINLWLAERDAENPEGTIFAIGHDAGVPHSSGNPNDRLQLGQTIVFDIFPCEAGGGYYYDFTRTWCLGYAPDPAQKLYDDVYSVYQKIMSELRPGAACHDYQIRTCELFEALGHPTVKSNPQTAEGYVHSLGHGVGLQVHERPQFGYMANDHERLWPGVVFTIEPGLYYPQRNLGVRLEDTAWVHPDGEIEVLADFPLDLVLKVKQ
jgi:Xaa-Pro aminopeptidase